MDFEFAERFIDKIVREYETRDVFMIAEKAEISIFYERWHPVTIGEFEKKSKTIRVNRNALEKAENSERLEKKIIAHELGHFFALDLNMTKADEEEFAREFAEILTADEN